MYNILRFLKSTLSYMQIFYEARLSPFLAIHMKYIYWLAYRLLKALNICFVVNIADVTGHVIEELDCFFRKIYLGKIDTNKRYVWLRKPTPISKDSVNVYKNKFWFTSSNIILYNILLPIIMQYKSITIDCGLSPLKWQLPDDFKYYKTKYGNSYWYLYQLSRDTFMRQKSEAYKLRNQCKEYFPLLDTAKVGIDTELFNFLNRKAYKLVLIHIKTDVVNATAQITDPKTYLPTLEYLCNNGYNNIVFVGREKMPKEFLRFGILNYANSGLTSFRHDIQLFKLAHLAITGGSGIAYMADCFGKHYLYLNSWMLPLLPPSEKCIVVPTLIKSASDKYLNFSEQIELYNSMAIGNSPEVLSRELYKGINASSDEILEGMKELMALKNEPSERTLLQRRFHDLTNGTPTFLSSARMSEYFLRKHMKFL